MEEGKRLARCFHSFLSFQPQSSHPPPGDGEAGWARVEEGKRFAPSFHSFLSFQPHRPPEVDDYYRGGWRAGSGGRKALCPLLPCIRAFSAASYPGGGRLLFLPRNDVYRSRIHLLLDGPLYNSLNHRASRGQQKEEPCRVGNQAGCEENHACDENEDAIQ